MENPEFKTIKSYQIDYGKSNFIEVALKEATEGGEANRFISISKGYTSQTGMKHYKRSLGFEVNMEVLNFLEKIVPELKKEAEKLPAKAKKEE
jgi:predicted aspartyl protease